MTSIFRPFAEALRAHAVFPPPSSSHEQQAAWKQGYDDAQHGVKQSPHESGSDLDSWYSTGHEDGSIDTSSNPDWGQHLNEEAE